MKHGGRREGAGRPRKSWRSCREVLRPVFRGWQPFHVTLRVHMEAVGRLRQRENYHAIRKAMHTALARQDFRIHQISLEVDHIHLLVEAADGNALKRGIHGFMVAAARRLNVEWAVDYYSSGPSFLGWAEYRQSSKPFPIFPAYQPLPVKPARTWLLAEGWRRGGPISLHDIPGH